MSRFKLDVTMTAADYTEYNLFHQLRSPYGVKRMIAFRITMAVVFLLSATLTLIYNNFKTDSLLFTIPLILGLIVVELLIKPFFAIVLKRQIKRLERKGKMAYAPSSQIEFFDDYIVESTPDARAEFKYTALERVSVIGTETIYLHINNIAAIVLPRSAFSSGEERVEFLRFIKTKCEIFDIYGD